MPAPYSRFSFRKTTCIHVLIFLLIAGCAEKVTAPLFTPDPTAFESALSQAIQAQLYIKKCSEIDDSLKPLADEAENYWVQTNGALVQAADDQYTQELLTQTFTYQNNKVALPAIVLRTSLERDISDQLNEKRQSFSSILAQCKFQLTNIKMGKLNAASNKNAELYLKSLVKAPFTTLKPLPTLAGSVQTYSPPGTAQYSAGKILQQASCNQEAIVTLDSNKITEDYAATCSNGKTVLIHCDLGQCEAKYIN